MAVGHYFQGRQGQRFCSRLVQAGVIQPVSDGFEDDAAVAAGIAYTDVAMRPTARADEVSPDELRHERELLQRTLPHIGAPALIFPFKAAAVALVGKFKGNGWLEASFAGCRLFVMPGPYEKPASADSTIATRAPLLC